MSGSVSCDGVHHIEVPDHVVDLGVDRVLPVDHGVGGRALLAEVHNGVGLALGDHAVGEGGVGQVPDAHVDGMARQVLPACDVLLERGDGHQAVDAHLAVVLAPHQVVDHGDLMAQGREM